MEKAKVAMSRFIAVALLLGAFLIAGCWLRDTADHKDEELPPLSPDHSAEEGRKRALHDIEAANPRILYFGIPWSVGKPLIDDSTGLPVEIVAGCCVSREFCDEVNAYNAAVREWAKKNLTVLEPPASTEFGEAAHGLQAGLSVTGIATKPEPMMILRLSVRNAGTDPVRVLWLHAGRKCWKHVPVEAKVGGKVLPYAGPVREAPPSPAVSAFNPLKPGGTHAAVVVVCPKYWGLEVPFDADLTFIFANNSTKATVQPYGYHGSKSSTVDGLWIGEARSDTVQVKMER